MNVFITAPDFVGAADFAPAISELIDIYFVSLVHLIEYFTGCGGSISYIEG